MTESRTQECVLVVDDSPVSRKLLEHALAGEPCRVVFAEDGETALRLFAQHRPALVITDWMLPDTTGPDLCKQIRAQDQPGYSYIVLLTSNAEKEHIVEGLAAGADDYLTKPFDRQELLARIGVGRRTVQLHREVAEKNRRLEELARTDHLTGLPNRRAAEEYGARQLRGAMRHKFEFWVVLADLDGFKSVNDELGHAAGDAVLRRFAELLKANTRAADFCARLGGDEFVLVLSHVDRENIAVLVEKLRDGFEREEIRMEGKSVQLTASFGAAGFTGRQVAEFSRLLAEADRALYQAKEKGRNRAQLLQLDEREQSWSRK